MTRWASITCWLAAGGTLLVAALLAGGCDAVAPERDGPQLVVEAFLEAGQPLGAIVLRRTTLLDTALDTARGVAEASVTLRLGERVVAYRLEAGRPGRYVPQAEAVQAPSRTDFTLHVGWGEQEITAAGRIPPPIEIDSVRVEAPAEPVEAVLLDSLRLDTTSTGAREGYIYPIEVTLRWRADVPPVGPDSAYWVRAQLRPEARFSSAVLDFFLRPEEVFREREQARDAAGRVRWTGVYAVGVDDKNDPLPPHRLRVALVRSGPAYARFAATRGDPDRREPLSNVEGGLGIAAGISIDSLSLHVE